MTGSTPVINGAINRLPGRSHEADLAAFALFLSLLVVLHSPLFVTREIAIRLSVDRAGSRRAIRFCLGVAAVISLVEFLFGFTSLGAAALRPFAKSEAVIDSAHRAFRYVWPAPLVIVVRGVFQAHQIQKDDTLFVGLGTLVRLGFTAVLGFVIAPRLEMEGATLGAIGVLVGISVETVWTVLRARAVARPPATSDRVTPSVWRFALPLMFANFLGLVASLCYLRIAGFVPLPAQEPSLAAFQQIRPFTWLFGAGAFALQSLTTAKVRDPADERPMVRFGLCVGVLLACCLGICILPPVRDFIFINLLNEQPTGSVYPLILPVLPLCLLIPFLNAIRFVTRGILIARGRTRAITFSNLLTLGLLLALLNFGKPPPGVNGAFNAFLAWVVLLALDLAILTWFARVGGDLPAPVRTPHEGAGA